MRSHTAGAGGLPAGVCQARNVVAGGCECRCARRCTRHRTVARAVELASEKRFTLYRRERFTLSGVFRVERLCGEMFYIYT
jgi:hypothetical protein